MKNKRRTIEVIARALISRDGSLLVAKKHGQSHLFLPGGHIEWNEPARRALERELREELGCKLKVGKFLGCVEHAFGRGVDRVHEINLIFLVSSAALPKDVASTEEKIFFQWLPITKLPQMNIQPYVLSRLIPWWMKNKMPTWAGTMEQE